jgi:PDZ domain
MTRQFKYKTLVSLLAFCVTVRPATGAEQSTATAAAATEAKPQAASDAQIATLIRQLDSNRYLERERATQALVGAGLSALDPLLAAANGDRPEAADRAVWVLRKLGSSPERDFALAALDRLVQVKNRPAVVSEAQQAQNRLRFAVCQEQLAKLGGQLTMVDAVLSDSGIVPTVRVELGDRWHGTVEDLKCLLALDQQHCFRLVGPAVGDEEMKLFETKDDLRLLQVFMSRVTPTAADSLKEHQPKAIVYIRNRALLGIQGDSQPNGVRVMQAQDNYGAAKAGILVGDVVTKIDGKPLQDFDRLTAVISQHQPGDVVEVTVLRGDETLTKKVTLSDQPPEQF